MTHKHTFITLVFAAVACLVLTGCSGWGASPDGPPPGKYKATKENSMTPDESVSEIIKLADAAETIIGSKWTKTPEGFLTPDEIRSAGSMTCYLPNGDQGTNYPLLWGGPGVPDPDKTIVEVQTAWENLGVKATITKVGKDGKVENAVYLDDPPHLTGTYPDGYSVSLEIGTNYSYLDASTHCIPIPDQYLYHPGDPWPTPYELPAPSTPTEPKDQDSSDG